LAEVLLTGLGPVAPNGVGKQAFWNAVKSGQSGIRRVKRFDSVGSFSHIAGVVPEEWLSGFESLSINSTWRLRLMATAARLALDDGGLTETEFSVSQTGISIGVSTVDMEVGEKEYDHFRQTGTTNSSVIAHTMPNAAASEIARALGCDGQVITVASACSSGLVSIIYTAEAILRDELELALAGGGDAPLTPFMLGSFSSAGLHPANTEKYQDEPGISSRPFEADREGGVLAEGAGMVILENSERVYAQGRQGYARLAGWGLANATSPRGLKAAFIEAMTQAITRAKLRPEDIDHISAHAPGIKLTDKAETEAIKAVFGKAAYNIPVSSIKSMIGNPLAASGPLQVIAAALVLKHKFVPPTTNYQTPDPHCDLDYVPNQGRPARIKTVMVNSAGIGGCIASLVITEPDQVAKSLWMEPL